MDKQKLNKAVAKYLELRDERDALKRKHKEELAPVNERLAKFEGVFGEIMNTLGLDSLPTPSGTAYRSPVYSAKVEDWDGALAFIQSNNAWYLLEKRVNKTAVQELAEEGTLVPGVALSSFVNINVRRK